VGYFETFFAAAACGSAEFLLPVLGCWATRRLARTWKANDVSPFFPFSAVRLLFAFFVSIFLFPFGSPWSQRHQPLHCQWSFLFPAPSLFGNTLTGYKRYLAFAWTGPSPPPIPVFFLVPGCLFLKKRVLRRQYQIPDLRCRSMRMSLIGFFSLVRPVRFPTSRTFAISHPTRK